MALLAINGADEAQRITLDFADLLTASAPTAWHARDVWAAVDLGLMSSIARTVPPHDCILLVLSPVHR